MGSSAITSWQIDGETMETVTGVIFVVSKITMDGDYSYEIKRLLLFGRKVMANLNRVLKSRNTTLLIKVCIVKAMIFPVAMYRCENWTMKKACWCFQTVVLEKTLESPLDCKKIKSVNLKGNQSWILTGRIDAEAPILWPPDVKSWIIGKDPDAGKDCGQGEKGVTEDETVGWHHWLNGHEFNQTRGDSEG